MLKARIAAGRREAVDACYQPCTYHSVVAPFCFSFKRNVLFFSILQLRGMYACNLCGACQLKGVKGREYWEITIYTVYVISSFVCLFAASEVVLFP